MATNPLRSRELSGLGKFFAVILATAYFGLIGGLAIMLFTSTLFPVFGLIGLGFWASASLAILGNVIYDAFTWKLD